MVKTRGRHKRVEKAINILKSLGIDPQTIDFESIDSQNCTFEDIKEFVSTEYGINLTTDEEEKEYYDIQLEEMRRLRRDSESDTPKFLKPRNSKIRIPSIFAFDVETHGQKNDFTMGSVVGPGFVKVFWDKEHMRHFLLSRFCRGNNLYATNLQFDFNALFSRDDFKNFDLVFRGSHLLKASYNYNEKNKINFFDSLNFAQISVEKMGKIIDMDKFDTPVVGLGEHWRRPKTQEEKDELERYNIQDSTMTFHFVNFLMDAFRKLNANPKTTIASTAIDCWCRNDLKYTLFQQNHEQMQLMLNAYYGGRCETIKRGVIKNLKYYDFNSLYPSVMADSPYPNPNTYRHSRSDERFYREYEGVTKCIIVSPKLNIPFLPVRYKSKLSFPQFELFEGWYTNVELRYAESIGYEIKKVVESHYYLKTDYYFRNYVDRLYKLRQEYKKDGNPMEYVCKLLLNSLYGKFAMRYDRKDEWIHKDNFDEEMYIQYDKVEELGHMTRLQKESRKYPNYVFPIFSIYTTAYGRIKLYEAIREAGEKRIYYMDTDSLITSHSFDDSKALGDLKLEMDIKEGYLVRPKFYAVRPKKHEEKDYVKIKGLNAKILYDGFGDFLKNPTAVMRKFVKMKESFRRGLCPNEVLNFEKTFKLEDEKRLWPDKFDPYDLQDSSAISI